MRIRGRLLNSNFTFNKKHPLVLCGKHWFTRKLFEHYYKILLHARLRQVLCSIRERFWPFNGLSTAKAVYRACVICFRTNPSVAQAIMGHLPLDRLSTNYLFSIVGTDYCGPFFVKDSGVKKYKLYKCYICIFICFSTKAIHLEPVMDLTTEAFMSTLRTFAARRGMPSKIYSDNGRNYTGARTELHKLGHFLTENKVALPAACAKANFDWHFIHPYAPNMGGLWEAGVKSTNAHLKRVMGEQKLQFFQLYHILVQIESVLNSRPLSPVSSNAVDLLFLTPAHFLIGRPLITVPDPNVLEIKENRLSQYQHLQKTVQEFLGKMVEGVCLRTATKTSLDEDQQHSQARVSRCREREHPTTRKMATWSHNRPSPRKGRCCPGGNNSAEGWSDSAGYIENLPIARTRLILICCTFINSCLYLSIILVFYFYLFYCIIVT